MSFMSNTVIWAKSWFGAADNRYPRTPALAVFVADGYAAVGDSAFMTYAVKGSGIAYSLMAGTLLANAIEQDEDCLFNCDTLWEYEKAFFRQIASTPAAQR